jgi:hypothetical protein
MENGPFIYGIFHGYVSHNQMVYMYTHFLDKNYILNQLDG